MNMMTEDLRVLIGRELNSLKSEIQLFPDDKTLWSVLPGISNSAGNLTLHVCGNLNYFIGSVLGNTGYIRDRESEFKRKSGSRAELVFDLQDTKEIIQKVLPKISKTTLSETYPKTAGGVELPCGRFLMHLATHLSFHVGQVGYLRRILTGNDESSNAISLRALSDQF
jgi:hypothetical protein